MLIALNVAHRVHVHVVALELDDFWFSINFDFWCLSPDLKVICSSFVVNTGGLT